MPRALLFLILVALGVLCLGWAVHEPYDETRLFAALPADTQLVTLHHDLGERADLIATNPLTRAVLMAASGNKPQRLFGLKKAPTTLAGKFEELLGLSKRDVTALEELLQVYAPKHAAVGIVAGASDESPAVHFVTHLGAKAHTLRALAGTQLEAVEQHRGQPVYVWDKTIHLSMSEGLLFGCFAARSESSRDGLHRMIDGLAGNADNLAEHQPERLRSLVEANVPDAAVWSVEGIGDMTLHVTELTRRHLDGLVDVPQAPSSPQNIDNIVRDLAFLYGNLPLAITVFQPGHGTKVFDALPAITIPDWVMDLQRPASVAVLGGEYSSSFLTMPSVVMTIDIANEAEGKLLLERVVAEAGDVVKPVNVETNGRAYIEFDTALNKGVGPLAYSERVACHITNSRMFLASSTKVLDRLLTRRGSKEATFEAESGRWLKAYMTARESASDSGVTGFGWLDADAFGAKTTVALSAAGVAFMRDKQKKKLIDRVKVMVDGLREMKRVSVAESVVDGSLVMKIRSGP